MVLTSVQHAEFCRVRAALKAYAADGGMGDAWLDEPVIDRFAVDNPAGLTDAERAVARAWRNSLEGPFFVMRHTGSCTIFMNAAGTFAVRGTERELSTLVPKTPTLVEVTLLPFDGLIVCADDPHFDPAALGEADRAAIDATYRALADKGVIYSAAAMVRAVRGDRAPSRHRMTRPAEEREGSPATPGAPTEGPHREKASPAIVRAAAHGAPALAPVEVLRPAASRLSAPRMPAGLAQVIAFKPRASADLACFEA